ncbi:MAG: hypothetical protein ACIRZH_04410 [Ligilactobacillus ruminis]
MKETIGSKNSECRKERSKSSRRKYLLLRTFAFVQIVSSNKRATGKNTNRWHFFAQEHRCGIKEAALRRHKAKQPARKTSRHPSRPKKAARLKETE